MLDILIALTIQVNRGECRRGATECDLYNYGAPKVIHGIDNAKDCGDVDGVWRNGKCWDK